MDAALIQKVRDKIKKLAPNADKAAEIEKSIVGGLSIMRSKWAALFDELGGELWVRMILKNFKLCLVVSLKTI
jgi:hypothetical protein